jgi:formylglycine-generating enzyme
MALTINITDTLRKNVEAASGGRNTVLYTAKGQPCYMAVVPKFNLQDIDASLGTGTHPAFIVGGVEKSQIFIGQHIGVSRNGEMLSLPGVDPIASINFDAAVSLVRANGTGWHLMSNIEWAALSQWCWKNGFQPRGNTQFGRSSDLTTEIGVRSDGLTVTGASQGSQNRTLTGSGPLSWRHDNTPFGIADLNGNVWEWSPGMRINNGEIQIITNNNAALSAADFGVSSTEWQAIDGATGALVAPGTAGTVKYASANSGTADYTLYRANGSSFEGMVNSTGANPVSAAALQLLKQHGLFPIAGSGLGGDGFYLSVSGERVPFRGGNWLFAAIAGVFALALVSARSDSGADIGARPAFVL